jgi:hypothetical protein
MCAMRKKCFLEKSLISLLIVIMLFNFVSSTGIGSISLAVSEDEAITAGEESFEQKDEIIGTRINGPVSIGGWLITFSVSLVCGVCQSILYFLASSGGLNDTDVSLFVTPLDIFFNKFTLLDINIFSTTDGLGNELDTDGLVYKLRTNTAFWYYVIRTIALAILLIMLIINLIKALSVNSTSEQKAVAKKALKDWIISLVLVMFMHILIIFIINVNNILVEIIRKVNVANNDTNDISGIMESIFNACFSSSFMLRTASLIVYALMTIQTVKYFLIYIQRFLTCLFLIIISPIMPVMFSTERTIGNRSVSLNGWFREFTYNVFLQTLHALIYAVMVSVAMNALGSQSSSVIGIGNLATAIIAIFSLLFISKAEKLLKSILGFDKAITVSNNVLQTAYNGATNVIATARTAAISAATTTAVTGMPPAINVQFGKNVNGQIGANQLGSNQLQSGGLQGLGNSLSSGLSNLRNTASSFIGRAFQSTSTNSEENQNNNDILDENRAGLISDGGNNIANENQGEDNSETLIIAGGSENRTTSNDITNSLQNEKEKLLKETIQSVSNKKSEKTEKIETYIADTNKTEKTEGNDGVVVGTDSNLLEEFKTAFKNLENNNSIVQKWGEEVDQKLDELKKLEEKLSPEKAKNIENIIGSMKSQDEINAYIKGLGPNTTEGKYAKALNDWNAYSELTDELGDDKRALIEEYKAKGLVIDDTLKDKLLRHDGAKVLETLITTDSGNSNSVDTSVEGEVIKNTETIDIPSSEVEHDIDAASSPELLANIVKNNSEIKKSAMDALELTNIFKGKVDIKGNITEGSINQFSIQVSKKLREGAYSQSNFDSAMQRVRSEGESAVKALEAYRNNPSIENARALSEGGKEFAKLQAEAQHAGLMITEAKAFQMNETVERNQVFESANPVSTNSRAVLEELKRGNNNNRQIG